RSVDAADMELEAGGCFEAADLVDDEAMAGGGVEQDQARREEDEQRDEQRQQLVDQPPRPVAAQSAGRAGLYARGDLVGHALERLPERYGDRQRAVAFLAIERNADVEPDRPQARIIARAKAGRGTPVLEVRQRFGGQRTSIEEWHDAEIAAELLEADARFERKFREASAADRVTVGVFWAKLLVAVAANRPAAARVEAPRRGDREGARAHDRAEPHSARGNYAVGHGPVGARVELNASIGKAAPVGRDFGAGPAAQTKSARRVQQAVAAVVA